MRVYECDRFSPVHGTSAIDDTDSRARSSAAASSAFAAGPARPSSRKTRFRTCHAARLPITGGDFRASAVVRETAVFADFRCGNSSADEFRRRRPFSPLVAVNNGTRDSSEIAPSAAFKSRNAHPYTFYSTASIAPNGGQTTRTFPKPPVLYVLFIADNDVRDVTLSIDSVDVSSAYISATKHPCKRKPLISKEIMF